jgi:hypothetical protein
MLTAEYIHLDTVDALQDMEGLFIAEVKAGTFTDHFVAILGIKGGLITIADPSLGKFQSNIPSFAREWRGKAIVIRKNEL